MYLRAGRIDISVAGPQFIWAKLSPNPNFDTSADSVSYQWDKVLWYWDYFQLISYCYLCYCGEPGTPLRTRWSGVRISPGAPKTERPLFGAFLFLWPSRIRTMQREALRSHRGARSATTGRPQGGPSLRARHFCLEAQSLNGG